ncbi:MAG: DUF1501 domain-containing protein [Planctomyces sp.]
MVRGPKRLPCPGPGNRREFLRLGTLGMSGLSLSQLLAARSQAAELRLPTDTSVILFWMWGGPSQLETWDMKPDAPSEYRGPFRPIPTSVPGMEICELFPRQARQAHRFSLIRSLHHEMAAHNDGSIELLTGKTPVRPDPTSTARSEHPDFGMVASRLRGAHPSGMPQYIGIPTKPFMTQPNYLGVSHTAYVTGDPSVDRFQPPNLTLDAGIGASRLSDRRSLIRQLDRIRSDADQSGMFDGHDRFQEHAFRLMTSDTVSRAFDLESEDAATRDRYGRTLWGQSCLLARRLAEAGSAVITIDALAPKISLPVYFSWDDHSNPLNGWDLAKGMKLRADDMDPALSALIDDIYDRGLDQKVMVVAVGEFGRTPRLTNYGGCLGRDHWPQAQSALIAGGGLRMGQVVGATNSKAEYPTERPLTPQDLLATIYRHLGIPENHSFTDFSGRPVPILSSGSAIRELI